MNRNSIGDELAQTPTAFSFFQAVRILEAMSPEKAPVGEAVRGAPEVVRFSAHPSIAFPTAEIDSIRLGEDGEPIMAVNFMGLIGPMGVLPLDYTALVAQRIQARDTTLRDFLDIFQHRMISLFYRAWLKHRFLVQRERGEEDTITTHLLDLAGLGVGAQRDLPGIEGTTLAGYAGLVAAQPRSAQALKQVLEDYFQVSVTVAQFIGDWYPLRRHDQCEVGDDVRMSSRLGMGALAGDEVWDSQAGVRVRIGPLDRATYRSFLPDGPAHRALRTILRYFSHGEHEFQVQLVLAEDEVPGLRLGDGEHQQLGWDTWLRTRAPARPADQTILRIDERDSQ